MVVITEVIVSEALLTGIELPEIQSIRTKAEVDVER